jgi:hypothetical protein
LYVFLSLPGQQGVSLIGEATAAPATLTPEQVYWNCRRAIFARYGRAATQLVDECVLRYKRRAAGAAT